MLCAMYRTQCPVKFVVFLAPRLCRMFWSKAFFSFEMNETCVLSKTTVDWSRGFFFYLWIRVTR